MLKFIHVKSEPADLRAIVLAGEAGDANLTACLLYLLVGGDTGGMVEVSKMARAYGVSDFTVTRWLRRLSKLGLVVVRLSGDGMLELDVKLKRGLGSVEKADDSDIGGSGEGAGATYQHEPKWSENPEVERAMKNEMGVLTYTQEGRLVAAVRSLDNCPTIMARSKGSGKMLTMLENTVMNALFDGLDLPRELMNADAWVQRKSYRDMPKFLVNWFRREAKKKKPLNNANAAPTGKYATAQAAARGK